MAAETSVKSARTRLSKPDLKSLRILLFDTDRTNASITKLALQQTDDLTFQHFTNADPACQHHGEIPFNVVLADFTQSSFNDAAQLVRTLRNPAHFG